jgi:TrmH family RNA methyltransferase
LLGSSEEIIDYLVCYRNFCSNFTNSNGYHFARDYTQGSIVVGTEATGLTQIWRENANKKIL